MLWGHSHQDGHRPPCHDCQVAPLKSSFRSHVLCLQFPRNIDSSSYLCLSVYLAVCLFVCLSVCLFVCFFVCVCVSLSLSLSVCLFAHLYPSIYLCIYPYTHMFIYISICMFGYLFVYVSIYLSTYLYLSICLSVCLFVCLSIYRSVHPSIDPSTHLYMHTCMHACMHACMHTYILTYRRAYIRTCIHTYVHTYMHACMHTYIRARITLVYVFLHASAQGMNGAILAYGQTSSGRQPSTLQSQGGRLEGCSVWTKLYQQLPYGPICLIQPYSIAYAVAHICHNGFGPDGGIHIMGIQSFVCEGLGFEVWEVEVGLRFVGISGFWRFQALWKGRLDRVLHSHWSVCEFGPRGVLAHKHTTRL